MHILQPKHIKLKPNEAESLLKKYNIALSQLPKIKHSDPALANLNVSVGDVIKIEREEEGKTNTYFRVVV